MPRVRILSGNETGAVIEMSGPEAQACVDTGFGEFCPEAPQPRLAPPKAKKGEEKREGVRARPRP